ncbi:hypothetical protein ACFST9_16475 [Hymenobacter monticola]|uniref:MarR family transcriptional regulator n=1 Tax=Hymenobacter monticola TaxID=1705399 RepID=A0ABY4B005_9BACT|nr:hypothetical protein [Hymenobacter monticola]UOE32496.1 hypothetical protein MTP16_15320 [Hymenobacter monticola]
MPDNLPTAFARRVAERDNPPPPPPLSMEPAAVQARIEDWLLKTYKVRDKRGRLRLRLMLLALMQYPERTTAELAEAASLPARAAARVAVRLGELDLTTWEYRSLYRYWRLTPAAEDALLLVVAGPQGAVG